MRGSETKSLKTFDLVNGFEQLHERRSVVDLRKFMTENAVKQAFHRLRQRYRQLLREEVAHTVATPAEIEDELRHLIAALRS